MRRMRWLVCGLAIIGMTPQTRAADLSDTFLRGSQTFQVGEGPRWGGFYAGAHASYSMGSADFGKGVSSLVNFALRNSVLQDQVSSWTTLSKAETTSSGFGGFIGYNWQWDEAVFGLEGNYTKTQLLMSSSDSLSRAILNNAAAPVGHDHTYNITVSGNATVELTDVATFRMRGGWDAGRFMPYAFAGIAVGRANVSRSATVSGTLTDNFTIQQTVTDAAGQTIVINIPQSITSTLVLPGTQVDAQNGVFAYGWTLGLGVDFCLMQNLFLRAEWEWVQFAAIRDMNVHTNTVRAAVAMKF